MKLRPPYISEMNIIDDFLDDDYHAELLSLLTGWEFPWFYQQTLTNGCDHIQAHGFNHWLSDEGDPQFCELVAKMQETVGSSECLRVRADMTLYNSEGYRHDFHTDCEEPHRVCIYYVNDSDGDTIFYDNKENIIKKISPKKGRIAFFNGDILHSGSAPTQNLRIVLNYNFLI